MLSGIVILVQVDTKGQEFLWSSVRTMCNIGHVNAYVTINVNLMRAIPPQGLGMNSKRRVRASVIAAARYAKNIRRIVVRWATGGRRLMGPAGVRVARRPAAFMVRPNPPAAV
ncbi:MAG: hypothetical protein K2L25_01510 [Alphaproteobacteria bacterium]|nr:hypothetical protein [Alphaproteobacteria bacterium]